MIRYQIAVHTVVMAEHWHNAHAPVERRREPQHQTLAIIRSQYNQPLDRITAGGNANPITLKTHAPAFFAGGGLANRQLGIYDRGTVKSDRC